MTSLLRDIAHVSLTGGTFNTGLWLLVTGMLLACGVTLAAIAPRAVDPVAVNVAREPLLVLAWSGGVMILTSALALVAATTMVMAPLTLILIVVLVAATVMGYTGSAELLGDRAARLAGFPVHPWVAAIIGLFLMRATRLIPGVGAAIHSMVVLFATGAGVMTMVQLTRSWRRRRLPDAVQFKDDGVIEWDDVTGGGSR